MDAGLGLRLCAILLTAVFIVSCAPSGVTTKDEGASPDPVMGDWYGHIVTKTGEVKPVVAQAIALGGGSYRFVSQTEFDRRDPLGDYPFSKVMFDGNLEGDRIAVAQFPDWSVSIANGVIRGRPSGTDVDRFELKHIVRLSPCLGATPPPGATVLFDGTSLAGWERRDPKQRETPAGWSISDGIFQVVPGTGDIMTKQKFTDFRLHIEFRTPFMPEAREQARGNSGVYLQGRYEVQVLDSYGLSGEDNECGGIYKISAPRVNMCAPPGQWQSYDITFYAPRFDGSGTKTRDASVTVLHNGIEIHGGLVLPGVTGGAVDEDVKSPGPLLLQDHGNLVQYRNVWLVEMSR